MSTEPSEFLFYTLAWNPTQKYGIYLFQNIRGVYMPQYANHKYKEKNPGPVRCLSR